jgi:uncharacterized protein
MKCVNSLKICVVTAGISLSIMGCGLASAAENEPDLKMGKAAALKYLKENNYGDVASNILGFAMDGKADAVIAMLASGVDPNLKGLLPQSPLFMATSMACISKQVSLADQLRTIDALIVAGADVNFQLPEGLGVLMMTAQQCPAAIVKRLLIAGAKIDQSSPQGLTPLSMALIVGNVESAKALVDAGAKISTALANKLFDGEIESAEIKALVKRATLAK